MFLMSIYNYMNTDMAFMGMDRKHTTKEKLQCQVSRKTGLFVVEHEMNSKSSNFKIFIGFNPL